MFKTIDDIILSYIFFLRPQDIIDILLVAYLVYQIIKLIRQTTTGQLVKGIMFLLGVLLVSQWFKLYTVNYIMTNAMQVGMVALIVVFQPELRRGLERAGRGWSGSWFSWMKMSEQTDNQDIEKICRSVSDAAKTLSDERIGAIIVIERGTKVSDVIRTGVDLDAIVTTELLVNIFTPNTPLHDGAVIIRRNRIMGASCLLPLTQNRNLSSELGTRHRAALGMSETSDSVVVIVSEETGKISIALDGTLTRNLTEASLLKALSKMLMAEIPNKGFPLRKGGTEE